MDVVFRAADDDRRQGPEIEPGGHCRDRRVREGGEDESAQHGAQVECHGPEGQKGSAVYQQPQEPFQDGDVGHFGVFKCDVDAPDAVSVRVAVSVGPIKQLVPAGAVPLPDVDRTGILAAGVRASGLISLVKSQLGTEAATPWASRTTTTGRASWTT